MDRIINYEIKEEYSDKKLNDFLISMGYTSSILTKLRQDDTQTRINDNPSFLNTPVKTGDTVSITIRESKSSDNIPMVKLDFEIIYEDDDIAIINKPDHMPIHPSLNNYNNSLANGLAYYYRNENSPFVYRCINRLDRDTTGLTIIAKNPLSGAILANKDNYSLISKTYYAIVTNGNPIDNSGTINKPIMRKDGSTIERCVADINLLYSETDSNLSASSIKIENAITHYEVLSRKDNLAFIRLKLETGRTHQIRVHMASIGHPLIGDFLYNPGDTTMSRQALHVGELSFIHPITKEMLLFKAPLPNDMKHFGFEI